MSQGQQLSLANIFDSLDNLLGFEDIIIAASDILMLVTVCAVCFFKKENLLEYTLLKNKISVKTLVWAVVLGVSLYGFTSILLTAFDFSDAMYSKYYSYVEAVDSDTLFAVISTVLIAPVTEEVLFRGIIFRSFKNGVPEYIALIFQALLFASMHGPSEIWMLYALFCGLVFGYITMLKGSILPTIIAHITFNAVDYALAYAPDSLYGYIIELSPLLLVVSAIAIYKKDN